MVRGLCSAPSGTVLQLLGLCPALPGWPWGLSLLCELFAKPEPRREEAAGQGLSFLAGKLLLDAALGFVSQPRCVNKFLFLSLVSRHFTWP